MPGSRDCSCRDDRTPDEIRRSLRTLHALRDGTPDDAAALFLGLVGGRANLDTAQLNAMIAAEEALLGDEYAREQGRLF